MILRIILRCIDVCTFMYKHGVWYLTLCVPDICVHNVFSIYIYRWACKETSFSQTLLMQTDRRLGAIILFGRSLTLLAAAYRRSGRPPAKKIAKKRTAATLCVLVRDVLAVSQTQGHFVYVLLPGRIVVVSLP